MDFSSKWTMPYLPINIYIESPVSWKDLDSITISITWEGRRCISTISCHRDFLIFFLESFSSDINSRDINLAEQSIIGVICQQSFIWWSMTQMTHDMIQNAIMLLNFPICSLLVISSVLFSKTLILWYCCIIML